MLATSLTLAITLLGLGRRAPGDTVPLYDNLGDHHYAVTTAVPAAQRYFDQGLRLYYAFNHAEAIRAFREAQRLDPSCAMCFWGEALAWGPNINLPMDSAAGVAAHAAVQRAVAVQARASDRERALIGALTVRYAHIPPANRAPLDSAYARAMATVASRYPADHEVAVLYAEALMDLRPWNYWTADGELQPGMADALAQLERVTAQNPEHPGACHFYIHTVEAAYPERAIPCAERLAGLMPGAGHLVHMPGHIYVRVGRYLDAIEANEHAVHADETYIRDQRPATGIYVAGYYPHNYDFMAFAAVMAGRSRQAIAAADKLASLAATRMTDEPGMAFLQHHATRALQIRTRFGRWEEILRAPAPREELLHARGIWHYTRGRALTARGSLREAEAELAQVRATAADSRLAGVRLEFNESQPLLRIAAHVLAGRIAAARRDYDSAVEHLQEAVRLEDALTYGEPPDWTIPVRHDLGAVLLVAKQPREAERVYREDLQRFPRNGWSLAGLAQALRAQERHADAAQVEAELRRAWAAADVPLPTATARESRSRLTTEVHEHGSPRTPAP
jgi:tetratricopeptide (TPR) repeat protein